jgi:hypothetical protein
MIRVGRRLNNQNPSLKGYKEIYSLTKCTPYGDISPYELKTEDGVIIENIWQFSKVYETVPKVREVYSRWDNTVIWEHGEEKHVSEDGALTDKYWEWREKGFKCSYAIRYPVGFRHRSRCLYSLIKDENILIELDYINARKYIYVPEYIKALKAHPTFLKLRKMHESGINLIITEIDGPHQESLDYYMTTYGVKEDFITDNTMLATKDNLDIMLNDPKHPFGHGYCIALALLN